MLADAIELLDRQVAFLLRQKEVDFFVQLPAFIDSLRADPRLTAAWDDTLAVAVNVLSAVNERRAALAADLMGLRRALPEAVLEAAACGSLDDESSIASFDRQAVESLEMQWPEGISLPTGSDPLTFMVDALKDQLAARHAEQPNAELLALRLRLRNANATYEHIRNEYELMARTLPGVSLARLASAARGLNPDPGVFTVDMEFVDRLAQEARIRYGVWRHVREFAFAGWWNEQQREKASAYLTCLRADVERAHEELRRRLGLRRSLRAVVDRYKMRAEWHDAAALRELAAQHKSQVEVTLTANLARYLHDQGLNPLTKIRTGGLEPDVLAPFADRKIRWTFYAEAKQYSKACVRYLAAGIREIADHLTRLRGTDFEVHEAFYMVFRLGGPLYHLPESVRLGDVTVYPVLIDIAEPKKSGSRQKLAPVVVTLEELVPGREGAGAATKTNRPARRKALKNGRWRV